MEGLALMSTLVKICGITNIEDAMVAAEAGAQAIGFMFYEASPRCVALETAEWIARRLPLHVMRVGVFVNPEPDFVASAMMRCALNMLQFHGEEPSDFCRQFGAMTIKAFRIKDAGSLSALSEFNTDAFLLDSYAAGKPGGTGEKFNWDLAVEAKEMGRPIFLAGGLTPENVGEAIRRVRPFGVDVSSGVESSPGKKDHAKIRAFIQAVHSAQ
jgi:phosphoribosylanthranilate isomerase